MHTEVTQLCMRMYTIALCENHMLGYSYQAYKLRELRLKPPFVNEENSQKRSSGCET